MTSNFREIGTRTRPRKAQQGGSSFQSNHGGLVNITREASPSSPSPRPVLCTFADATPYTGDQRGTQADVRLYVGGLIDMLGGGGGRPQGFIVQQHPHHRTGAHFHDVDQFQIFFGSVGATYQRSPIDPDTVVVHYTDAYTTYGPFASGEAQFDFFTLRAHGTDFVAYMPGGRDLMRVRGHRAREATLSVPAHSPLDPGETSSETVFDEKDNLACWRLRAGVGAVLEGPPTSAGSGQYYCVIHGRASRGGKEYGPKSLAWVEPNGTPLTLHTASGNGADVVIVQFPDPPSAPLPTTPAGRMATTPQSS